MPRASSRNVPTLANHCSVALKIVGFFVLQSYGYLWGYDSKEFEEKLIANENLHKANIQHTNKNEFTDQDFRQLHCEIGHFKCKN